MAQLKTLALMIVMALLLCTIELKEVILREAHDSLFSMHPSGTKMYRDLRELYWWPGMKREIVEFVSK